MRIIRISIQGSPVLDSLAPRDALALLYRDHSLWLRGWIHRRLGCRHQAADLAQATFCRLLENGSTPLPRSPRSFLATVARRLLVDDLRHRDVEREYAACHATLHGDTDPLTPERIAEASELLRGILELLGTLPVDVRRAFVLRRIDGLAHEEIASELGISARTVKRHVARAYLHFYSLAFSG